MKFALIGNPNCGKTTLFNQLTGSKQHVGNFPGVTVDKKEGRIRKHEEAAVVDLPGIYSLSPYTAEEIVTRDFLIKERPDGIINIVDATNIERNLYLTLQLLDLNIPMILALNMMDVVTSNGGKIDVEGIENRLGIPIIPISASRNQGVDDLISRAVKMVHNRTKPERRDFCTGDVHRAIHSIAHLIEDEARAGGVSLRFAAIKLVEGDEVIMRELRIQEPEQDIIRHIVDDMEFHCGMDREAALADARYKYIEQLCRDMVVKPHETRGQKRSVRIDRVLTHRIFAIPIFLGIMMFIFWITFGAVGATLSDWFSMGIDFFIGQADRGLTALHINETLRSLIIDGVCSGVGSVLSFLPTIVLLFFMLSILEDSGYMARVSFVMDNLLRKIGLSGRSFVPMLIGFGCSVPAIMATRTLSSERDRRLTIMLIPFMSCSAKLPIYAMFTAAFFTEYRALVMISLYLLGIFIGILCGFVMKRRMFDGEPIPFVMELPEYRMPAARSVILHMWEKAKDFVRKAFTVIFLATIVIWFLQTFDVRFNLVADSSDSMLAGLGHLFAPVLAPLGFGDWRSATALLTGFSAKEAVVSTLTVLTGAGDSSQLAVLLGDIFTPLTAYCFLVFCLLYTPCVAAVAAVRRELGGMRRACGVVAFQLIVAWAVTFIVYRVGLLFF